VRAQLVNLVRDVLTVVGFDGQLAATKSALLLPYVVIHP
jgi:hypothetical protein